MPIRSEYYVLLKCGCISTTMGMLHQLGDGKNWYQSCDKHSDWFLIIKTYKNGIEMWRDLERQRANPTLF